MIEVILFCLVAYFAFRIGRIGSKTALSMAVIADAIERAKIPVAVVNKIDDHFYMFDKDTGQFLVQAATVQELPIKLLNDKKVPLAMVLYPEEAGETIFFCIDGKITVFK